MASIDAASNICHRLKFGAAQLQTPAEQEQWYPSEHMMQAFSNNAARFMSSDEDRVVEVDILWAGLGTI